MYRLSDFDSASAAGKIGWVSLTSTDPSEGGASLLVDLRAFEIPGLPMATTQFVKAERLQKLPPYLFAEIDKKKKAAIAAGRDVINLGVGDPDKPTPSRSSRASRSTSRTRASTSTPSTRGLPSFARASPPSARSGTASTSTRTPRSSR